MSHFRLSLSGAIATWALCTVSVAQPPPVFRPDSLIPDAEPVRSCESLTDITLPDTTVESAVVENGACRIMAVASHPAADDRITIWIGVPMSGWNGRFLGTGGGGFVGGSPDGVVPPLAAGFAAGATDTGHEGGSASFALREDGRLNWPLIRDFAHVGVHEMTVTGKALTEALYGEPPRYSYFRGCSTGGRQGLMEAQRYPDDYNGIVSAAPAINWTALMGAGLWGAVLMNTEQHPVAACKLAAATAAAVASCDLIDGVEDGILADPTRCYYDPHALVGNTYDCGTFSEKDAEIVQSLWLGPRREDERFLWYGMPPGADLTALAATSGEPLQPRPSPISLDWFRYFLAQDPDFDWTGMSRAAYEQFWDQSIEQYSRVIATDYPNLNGFRDNGGKIIVWHGWADQLITAYGTTDYYSAVTVTMGGQRETEDFMRLFMAPGVGHCAGGPGPQPTGLLEAIIAWVEQDEEPETLPAVLRNQAGEIVRTRPLCVYPEVAVYSGRDSTDDAGNFDCRDNF